MRTKFNPFTGDLDYVGDDYSARIEAIETDLAATRRRIDDLHYEAIQFASAACSPAVAEMGSTVESIVISWKLNKTPDTLAVNGATQQSPAASGSVKFTGLALTQNQAFGLSAKDERDAEATATARLYFYNSVYYGTGAAALESIPLDAFKAKLQNSRALTFTANAGEGEHIYFAYPARFGACTFNVGGFEGGFTLVTDTLSHTNASGYTELYRLYRSDNAGLGETKVVASYNLELRA